MSLSRQSNHTTKKKPIVEDVIIFHVGGSRFAIASQDVEEIRNMDGLKACASGLDTRIAKVKSTFSRTKGSAEHMYYVVTSAMHFGVAGATPTRLLVLRDFPVALLADSVDRMMQVHALHALPHAFQGPERNWYRGLAIMDGKVVPMVEPSAFLGREELQLLATKTVAVSA